MCLLYKVVIFITVLGVSDVWWTYISTLLYAGQIFVVTMQSLLMISVPIMFRITMINFHSFGVGSLTTFSVHCSLLQHACTIYSWGNWQLVCKFQNHGYANIRFVDYWSYNIEDIWLFCWHSIFELFLYCTCYHFNLLTSVEFSRQIDTEVFVLHILYVWWILLRCNLILLVRLRLS